MKTLLHKLLYRFNNDRNFVISFIAIACFCLIGNSVVQLAASRKIAIAEADVNAQNMAKMLRQHGEDAMKSADTTLLGMTSILQRQMRGSERRSQLLSLMAQSSATLEQAYVYLVYDANGRQVLRSDSSHLRDVSEDDEFFRFHQENFGSYIHIGKVRRDPNSGVWVIPVSRRVSKGNREFAGVVVVELMFEYFKEYYEAADVGRSGSIILSLDDGTMLVHRPFYHQAEESRFQHLSYFKDSIAQMAAGGLVFRDSEDGETKHAAFQHFKRYPMFVFVALSESEALQGWWRSVWLYSLGMLILIATLVFCGIGLVRRVDGHARIEDRLKERADSLTMMNVDLHKLAYEDGLTGLGNRRSFNIAIENEITRARRTGNALSLVMIDVDYFKSYNDLYGHAAGDECLRRIGAAIKLITRKEQDLVARYGGEELVMLLPGAELANAVKIANLAVRSIENLAITHEAAPLGKVTISAGVMTYSSVSVKETSEAMIEQADHALYDAKNGGKNRVCFAMPERRSGEISA